MENQASWHDPRRHQQYAVAMADLIEVGKHYVRSKEDRKSAESYARGHSPQLGAEHEASCCFWMYSQAQPKGGIFKKSISGPSHRLRYRRVQHHGHCSRTFHNRKTSVCKYVCNVCIRIFAAGKKLHRVIRI